MIVVDTNVASELMKLSPSPTVRVWERGLSEADLHTTAVSVAEVLYGIARLADGRRKDELSDAARRFFSTLGGRVLRFDVQAAAEYAAVKSDRERQGEPIGEFDAQIAGICRVHGAALATRNTKDFRNTGVELVNPWE